VPGNCVCDSSPLISTIDDAGFLDATVGGYTVVDFWAPWCGPCHQFAPLFETIATRYSDRLRFGRCDVDQSPATAAMVGIMSIPTVVVFEPNGNELTRITGTPHPRQFDELIRNFADLAADSSEAPSD